MTVRIPARRRHTGFRVLVIAAALVVGTAALAGPTGAARVRHDRHGRHRYAGQPLRPSVAQVSPASFEFEIPHPASGSYPARVTLTVTGNRFRAGAAVLFNGRAVPTTFVSPARLTAQVPFDWVRSVAMASPSGGPDGFHGNATVTVRNPGRQGGRSSARAFSVHATPID